MYKSNRVSFVGADLKISSGRWKPCREDVSREAGLSLCRRYLAGQREFRLDSGPDVGGVLARLPELSPIERVVKDGARTRNRHRRNHPAPKLPRPVAIQRGYIQDRKSVV